MQVVVGRSCGKSCMIAHLTTGKFVKSPKPTTRTPPRFTLLRGGGAVCHVCGGVVLCVCHKCNGSHRNGFGGDSAFAWTCVRFFFFSCLFEEDLVQHTVPLDGVQYDVSILEIGSSASSKKVFPKVQNTTQHDTTHSTTRHNQKQLCATTHTQTTTELGREKGQGRKEHFVRRRPHQSKFSARRSIFAPACLRRKRQNEPTKKEN